MTASVDVHRMHADCLARTREQLRRHDMAAALLCDPLNVRYVTTDGCLALLEAGVQIADAELALAQARAVKSPEEVKAMRHAAHVCDAAVSQLRALLQPGITELGLWAGFTARAIEMGAEYSEARLLVSGPRTKPWLYEASGRVIESGDLIAFDTDLVGPHGYEIDISRTYLCGETRPRSEQQRVYAMAHEFLHNALGYFRPGASFDEIGARIRSEVPREFAAVYPLIAHGVGRTLEYPVILWDKNHTGELEENMVMSVEVYAATDDAVEGVKLEEEILITSTGHEVLSTAPYDDRLA
jgi:Xaa-Pro dipeptidase